MLKTALGIFILCLSASASADTTFTEASNRLERELKDDAVKKADECGMKSVSLTVNKNSFKGQDPEKVQYLNGGGSCGNGVSAAFAFCQFDTLKAKASKISSISIEFGKKNSISLHGKDVKIRCALEDPGADYFEDAFKKELDK